jgi:hypothetical protein
MKNLQRDIEVERSVTRLIAFWFSVIVLPIGIFFGAQTVYLLARYGARETRTVSFAVIFLVVTLAASCLWIALLKCLRSEIRVFRDAKRDPLKKLGT